ncbi:putative transcription factor C2H2 family [Helianthus debilis subsp. tardiflorus]
MYSQNKKYHLPPIYTSPYPFHFLTLFTLTQTHTLKKKKNTNVVMTRTYRFLSNVVLAESPEEASIKSDFVFIVAALLCALVCVVGLIAVAHCAWLRRRAMATGHASSAAAANKGIEKKYVDTIPKFPYDSSAKKANNNNDDCVICLVEYADGDEIRVLPQCGHGFHIGCIDKWLGSHSSCPSCRQIVVIDKCKKCGGFPKITPGNILIVTEHEHSGGSGSGSGSGSVSK